MVKYSPFLLLLTIPFFSSQIYYGVPLWAYISLGATAFYALVLIFTIETKYQTLKEDDE
ncbi:MAG: hypothetical protein JXQ67_02915 [Campylobacterales bacterium]|nr:hypothetical protein [Campylobacterales bacterium]